MSDIGAAIDDFVGWAHPSPLLDRLGELWQHRSEAGRFGFVVDDPKLNSRGLLHAGAISTIADVCLGHTLSAAAEPGLRFVTANLNLTFVGAGRPGRWIDVVAQPQRVGRRMATGSITFTDGDRLVAHATGLFIPSEPPRGDAAVA
jgi:acyl-coenzyme A thioesterase 13